MSQCAVRPFKEGVFPWFFRYFILCHSFHWSCNLGCCVCPCWARTRILPFSCHASPFGTLFLPDIIYGTIFHISLNASIFLSLSHNLRMLQPLGSWGSCIADEMLLFGQLIEQNRKTLSIPCDYCDSSRKFGNKILEIQPPGWWQIVEGWEPPSSAGWREIVCTWSGTVWTLTESVFSFMGIEVWDLYSNTIHGWCAWPCRFRQSSHQLSMMLQVRNDALLGLPGSAAGAPLWAQMQPEHRRCDKRIRSTSREKLG